MKLELWQDELRLHWLRQMAALFR